MNALVVFGLVSIAGMVAMVAIVAITFNRHFKGRVDKNGTVNLEVHPSDDNSQK